MNVTKTPKVLWRQARSDDFDAAYAILRSAARRMVQQGRHQWDDSYPQKEDVQNDISLAQAYVLESDEKVVAYGVVSFDGEPAYDALYGGEWLSRGKYAVVHRMMRRCWLCTRKRVPLSAKSSGAILRLFIPMWSGRSRAARSALLSSCLVKRSLQL